MSEIKLSELFAPSFIPLHSAIKRGDAVHYWIKGGRGCVHGDTLIDTPTGKVAIRDFRGGDIYAMSEDGIVIASAGVPARYHPEQLYKISTDRGSVRCTAKHRFLTNRGWVSAADLSLGDTLPTYHGASFDQLQTYCAASLSEFHADVQHYFRTVLGFLYCYFLGYRQCGEQPPVESDTFLNALQVLADGRQHNCRTCLPVDVLESLPSDDLQHSLLSRLSIQCALLCGEALRFEEQENYSGDMFSELLSGLYSAFQQFHKCKDLSWLVRTLSEQILAFVRGDSQEQSRLIVYELLLHDAGDNSYSDSFLVSGQITPSTAVVSIEKDEIVEFYDIFVPFFNNYLAEGMVHHNSSKSSFVSLQIILGIVRNPEANAIAFRKFGCDLRGSVFNQILWAIDILGLRDYFTYCLTPMEITYKPTGQKILFKGLDDARKSKSQKAQFGYFRYVWFEELEQYDGMQEIRSVCQSLMRGGDNFSYFYSYNPPQNTSNWVNFESGKAVENRLVHHSDYLTVPKDWLGEAFFIEADILRKQNEMAYRHEYLGEVTGTGGTIFTNLISRPITDEEIRGFSNLRKGIDWGYAVDPFAYGALEYDKTRRTIYIYDEIYKVGLLNDAAIEMLKAKGIGRERVIADSAEPKSIAEFRQNGLNVIGAEKGKDSVQYGIKWLQKLHSIVIDPIRCPNLYKEFSLYEFEKTKTGEFKSEYPDKLNHGIDLVRYSLSLDMEKKGMF